MPMDGRTASWHASWLLMLLLISRAAAPPPSPYDKFKPYCRKVPHPKRFQRWSRRSTWGGEPVPGVRGQKGANVTIHCGQAILLDLPVVELTALNIRGTLKFLDSPTLPSINLTASLVLVQGRLTIGTPHHQFSQKATIFLAPNPKGRANFTFTEHHPAEPAYPRTLGHKAVAVVGGQVSLHGMPGSAATPSWVKLGASAAQGDRAIVVRGDVSGWPVGAPLAIAPTDFSSTQDDVAVIRKVVPSGKGLWTVHLDRGLAFNHYGDPRGVPDGFGGYIDETAEVALLSRNIVIRGADEPPPNELEGGHFMVYHTQTKQLIEGVQFLFMGQQGKLGRYNIHFHMCGDLSGDNSPVVRKNLMIHSKQRCVVIHATHNVTIDSNVAYNTSGHCFMVEEGAETNNTFIGNLGMRTRAVRLRIPKSLTPFRTDETDDRPATFWITNPSNNFINNIGAGSEDSAFWLELKSRVRGMSALMPTLNRTNPRSISKVGIFSGNVGHSNAVAGWRTYPGGWRPLKGSGLNTPSPTREPVEVELGGFTFWKQPQGMFVHNTYNVTFTNCSLADNVLGIYLAQVQNVTVSRSRFVGTSANYGNPANCQDANGASTCAPITGCRFPLPAWVEGRSVPMGLPNLTVVGVAMSQNGWGESVKEVNLVTDCTFSSFDNSCHPAAAVGAAFMANVYWSTGHSIRALKFDTERVTNPVLLYTRSFPLFSGNTRDVGEPSTMAALRDLDGSIIGSREGGYVVANNPMLLPPSSSSLRCSLLAPNSFALACPGACYRTVRITYSDEPMPANLSRLYVGPTRPLGLMSYLVLTRVEDGASVRLEGNLQQMDFDRSDAHMLPFAHGFRVFPMTLLGGHAYEIQFVPGKAAPQFVPRRLSFHFADGGGCGQGVSLRLKATASFSWAPAKPAKAAQTACSGASTGALPPSPPVEFRQSCAGSPLQQQLDLLMGPSLPSGIPVSLVRQAQGPAPCSAAAASVLADPCSKPGRGERGEQ